MEYCFYLSWNGLTPSEWAAWTQAILSAVAIYAAARLATSQERRARRARIDAYVEIVSHAQSEASSTLWHLQNSEGSAIRTNLNGEWTKLCKVFASIPFHDVPDFRLYGIIRDASRCAETIRDIYEPLCGYDSPVTESHISAVNTEKQTLDQCYLDAIEVSNKLVGRNIRGKVNFAYYSVRAALKRVYNKAIGKKPRLTPNDHPF